MVFSLGTLQNCFESGFGTPILWPQSRSRAATGLTRATLWWIVPPSPADWWLPGFLRRMLHALDLSAADGALAPWANAELGGPRMNCTHPSGATVQPLCGITPRLTEGKEELVVRANNTTFEHKWLDAGNRTHDGTISMLVERWMERTMTSISKWCRVPTARCNHDIMSVLLWIKSLSVRRLNLFFLLQTKCAACRSPHRK